jgi:hypothetical protein
MQKEDNPFRKKAKAPFLGTLDAFAIAYNSGKKEKQESCFFSNK